jgi:hypothetical protein
LKTGKRSPRVEAQMFLNNRHLGILAIAMFAMPAVASGQNLAVTGGANINPDQVYVGAKYDWPLLDRVWFEPSVDVGFGNDAKLIAGNVEATYRRPLSRRGPWTLVAGGGPALNHYRLPGVTETELGFNLLGGVRHARGIFTEFRVGLGDSPELRFGIGYTFRPARPAAPPRR